MGNLPALLPNATPLVSRFFAKMSKKSQRCAVVNLKNNFSISAKFTHVYCNCEQQLSQKCGKMGFTIEDKALIDIDFSRGGKPIKRLCIGGIIIIGTTEPRQTFR
jgi:hypothetical protein